MTRRRAEPAASFATHNSGRKSSTLRKIEQLQFIECKEGCSSIGRASVSKTEGWGFETLHPCQFGGSMSAPAASAGSEVEGGSLRTLMAKLNPVEFIQEVRQEVSKVTWPAWKEVWITTAMVLVMVTLASLFFLISDQAIGWVVQFVLALGR
jgi:preprotein translocase subunit SecE